MNYSGRPPFASDSLLADDMNREHERLCDEYGDRRQSQQVPEQASGPDVNQTKKINGGMDARSAT